MPKKKSELFDKASLFEEEHSQFRQSVAPLAERMRPASLDEVLGQDHLLGKGQILRQAFERGDIASYILWGPPGTGKTTIARLLAELGKYRFVPMSAVFSGVADLRQAIAEAVDALERYRKKTLLFLDEIHRWNKAQQDAFLPHLENGTFRLVGATTENPSFELNAALLSRTRVLTLQPLAEESLVQLLKKALADPERGLGKQQLRASEEILLAMARLADGDARSALNLLEETAALADIRSEITKDALERAASGKSLRYDKNGEEHYNLISALHKCVRDSDPDAALYWLARMLEAGEAPLFIARRLVRAATEDIGLAAPQALQIAIAAMQTVELLGMPEASLALAEAAIYLSLAPKSNSTYVAYKKAAQDAKAHGALPVPLHLRNAPTRLMQELGYGAGYAYAHDHKDAEVQQDHFPAKLGPRLYYEPTDRGQEKAFSERLKYLRLSRFEENPPQATEPSPSHHDKP